MAGPAVALAVVFGASPLVAEPAPYSMESRMESSRQERLAIYVVLGLLGDLLLAIRPRGVWGRASGAKSPTRRRTGSLANR